MDDHRVADEVSMKVLVFVTIPEQAQFYRNAILARHPQFRVVSVPTVDAAAAEMHDTDILMSFGAPLRHRDVFSAAPRLKWVNTLGTGLDGIMDSPTLDKQVIVTSTRGIHGVPMSEMAFMLMLALARDFPRVVHQQDNTTWRRWTPRLLQGRTVAILGIGLIAEQLAPRCQAFGMRVVGISRRRGAVAGFDEMRDRSELVIAARAADFLVLLIPLEADTENIVDAAVIAALKPTSCVINLARGGVLDEEALMAALTEGRIAGAALDAFQNEPLPPDSPWWRAPNTIVTPHISGTYDRYAEDAFRQFEGNLAHFLAGRPDLMINREQ
jgi:phosphoglycerate dehydrogenase-like enzyme